MIEQLKSAGDQLRESWDNYCNMYSILKNNEASRGGPNERGFPPELTRQLETELAFISSYESKIRHIKAVIGRARNYSPSTAKVNTLPAEILRRIFHFVFASPCDPYLSPTSKRHCPRYADSLAHVCSLWRRIAISSRALWCRIDVSPYYRPDNLAARVWTYAMRAGKLPLELHIATNKSGRWIPDHSGLYRLLPQIARRVKDVELWISHAGAYYHHIILGLLMRERMLLDQLVVRTHEDDTYNIFQHDMSANSMDMLGDRWPLIPNVPFEKTVIDKSLASLTVLHLRDIFPSWSSKAYHDLVDLRLLLKHDWTHIEEVDLINILKSSPRLRILYFGIEISRVTPFSEYVTPIHLPDLQVVKTFIQDAHQSDLYPIANVLLRLLAPGTKPLRLSITGLGVCMEGASILDAEDFFARSRVTTFHTRTLPPPMSLLLRHAARLESVILEGFETPSTGELLSSQTQWDKLASLPRLKSLHITESRLSVRELDFLMGCCPTGTVLHSCKVAGDEDGSGREPAWMDEEMLSYAFSDMKVTDRAPAVLANWDIMD